VKLIYSYFRIFTDSDPTSCCKIPNANEGNRKLDQIYAYMNKEVPLWNPKH